MVALPHPPALPTPPPFEEVYRSKRAYIGSILTHALPYASDEQIEDLIQETFLKAWKAYERFEPRNLNGWLACIAHRVAADTNRQQHRKQVWNQRPLTDLDAETLADEASEEHLIYTGDADVLQRIIQRLPPVEQKLFPLFLQGYRIPELATACHMSIYACQWRIRNARRLVRKQYQDLQEQEEALW